MSKADAPKLQPEPLPTDLLEDLLDLHERVVRCRTMGQVLEFLTADEVRLILLLADTIEAQGRAEPPEVLN